jgi:hypothetical protein
MVEHRSTRRFPTDEERQSDLDWIRENTHLFLPMAREGFDRFGRGALVVDTTQQPTGEGHPFGYFPQEMLEDEADEDTLRLVSEYEPDGEFVAVLLKHRYRVSSYRLRMIEGEPREAQRGRVDADYKQEPPDIETLIAWEMAGYCEATDGCVIEPDGICPHGHQSWLLELGLI